MTRDKSNSPDYAEDFIRYPNKSLLTFSERYCQRYIIVGIPKLRFTAAYEIMLYVRDDSGDFIEQINHLKIY